MPKLRLTRTIALYPHLVRKKNGRTRTFGERIVTHRREGTADRCGLNSNACVLGAESPPVASDVAGEMPCLGLERVPSNVVGEAFGSC